MSVSIYAVAKRLLQRNAEHRDSLIITLSLISTGRREMQKTRDKNNAVEERFEARIDKVRTRFASKLAEKILHTSATLPRMCENSSESSDLVANPYRWLHDVGGIALTIGFEATGQSARLCESILVEPYRAQRGLSDVEFALMAERLESLRANAHAETRAINLIRGLVS